MKRHITLMVLVAVTTIFWFKISRFDPFIESNWLHNLDSDVHGYYMYLPAVFIYHDLQNNFIQSPDLNERYDGFKLRSIYPGTVSDEGIRFSKYYIGTAVLVTPFFFIAAIIADATGAPMDGYSIPFQLSVFAATLFYLLLGLFFIRKLLLSFNLSENSILFTLFGISFATNVFNYTGYEPGFSHLFAFFTISVFLYTTRRFFLTGKVSSFLVASVFLGLTTIIRPTSIIIVLATPFMAGATEIFKSRILSIILKPIPVLLSVISFALIVFIQLLYYYFQTGSFFVWSYSHEGFEFLNPQIFEVLFGFRKGLFIYSPFVFLSIVGGIYLFFKNRFYSVTFFVCFAAFTYVISSWWCWWYGGSFGMRAMIDFYPFLSIPIAFLAENLLKTRWRYVLVTFLIICSFLNIFQSWQYYNHIIAGDKMNFAKYRQVFLETDDVFKFATEEPEELRGHENPYETIKYFCDLGSDCGYPWRISPWGIRTYQNDETIYHEVINDKNSFGGSLKIEADSLNPLTLRMVIYYKGKVRIHKKNTTAVVVLVVDNESDSWKGNNIVNQVRETDKWTWINIQYSLWRSKSDTNDIELYIYHNEADDIDLDSAQVEINTIGYWEE